MTKVIACAHEKGGVGKTTTTVNLGVGLARQGKKVLLLDADPQGDLTKCLGVKDPKELKHTISTVMDYLIAHSDEDNYPDLEYYAPIRQHSEGVDFIPANAGLAATEVTLVNSMSRETILKQYLDMVKDEYDYVLIDCRPSMGLTVVNALTAADSIIIPVQAHILAADDMDALFKTIGRVKRNLNPRLQVDGIVMTMVDSRTNLSRNTIRAVREKLDAIKRQGERVDLTSRQVGEKLSVEIVSEKSPDSARNIHRFIRLTELAPPLLSMVDDRKIALNPAVELSYLSMEQQTALLDLMEAYDSTPSLAQAQRLKEAAKAGKLDRNGIELVLQEEKPNQKEVLKLPRERFAKYFTADMPPQKIEETIVKALDMYYCKLERDRQAKEYVR